MNFDKKRLLELGKIHKKDFEKIEVNPYAYFIDDTPYYFVLYKSRFIGTERGYAIISPTQSVDHNKSTEAFAAFFKFIITKKNIENGVDRTNVELSSHEEVKNYLEIVLKKESLDTNTKEIYRRAFETLDQMFKLQNEFNGLWNDAKKFLEMIDEKNIFSREELEQLLNYVPSLNLIQYKQLHKRYVNSDDFNYIYKNRNELTKTNSLIKPNTLKGMTSQIVKSELENLINNLTRDINITSFDSYDSIHQKWDVTYRRGLEDLINEKINHLRYPS
ncbi:hypothetical protein [Piscibacillus halophilus]|uniref:Uncharacterized protein n=1 Tax=Piscibacillus halophilus TaxID=571933 RepID=A0A1H9CBH9_9BACI|nr:hypothetical protein [Piscibacillus halophilus]SEP98347.1 hypothetical protein SAMN05216362_10515 [Piscibacillus halophilus]